MAASGDTRNAREGSPRNLRSRSLCYMRSPPPPPMRLAGCKRKLCGMILASSQEMKPENGGLASLFLRARIGAPIEPPCSFPVMNKVNPTNRRGAKPREHCTSLNNTLFLSTASLHIPHGSRPTCKNLGSRRWGAFVWVRFLYSVLWKFSPLSPPCILTHNKHMICCRGTYRSHVLMILFKP